MGLRQTADICGEIFGIYCIYCGEIFVVVGLGQSADICGETIYNIQYTSVYICGVWWVCIKLILEHVLHPDHAQQHYNVGPVVL